MYNYIDRVMREMQNITITQSMKSLSEDAIISINTGNKDYLQSDNASSLRSLQDDIESRTQQARQDAITQAHEDNKTQSNTMAKARIKVILNLYIFYIIRDTFLLFQNFLLDVIDSFCNLLAAFGNSSFLNYFFGIFQKRRV